MKVEFSRINQAKAVFDDIYIQDDPRSYFSILGDLDYPGWKATVDGAPVRILRADRGLRAVTLPAGRHRVVFTFDPMSVRLGSWLSLAALIAIVALLVVPPRAKARGLHV